MFLWPPDLIIDWAYACTDIKIVFCFMSIYPDGIGILMWFFYQTNWNLIMRVYVLTAMAGRRNVHFVQPLNPLTLFTLPEPKTQVSFYDWNLSVIVVVFDVLNFSHFHCLLLNHLANFNQTIHKVAKSILSKRIQFCWKGELHSFPRGENSENTDNLKIFFSRTTWPIQANFAKSILGFRGSKFVQM